VLNSFSNKLNSNAANDKLVYFNENTQLNDLIYNKDRLLLEQAKSRLDLVSFDKIIKDNSVVLNKLNKESLNGKMKYIIPMMLIFIYLALYQTIRFYKTQLAKTKEQE